MNENWLKQSESTHYIKAVKATESIESPAQGFVRPVEFKSTHDLNKALIKQNNTLISLLLNLHEQIQELKTQFQQLRRAAEAPVPGTAKELESSIEELSKKLSGLSLGADQVIPKKRGKILIFKNPSDILQQERSK